MQAEGQCDQSEAASEDELASSEAADLADLSNSPEGVACRGSLNRGSPEGVANWATNNKHVDTTNNIIAAAHKAQIFDLMFRWKF